MIEPAVAREFSRFKPNNLFINNAKDTYKCCNIVVQSHSSNNSLDQMSNSPESSPKGSPMRGLRAVAHSLIRHASSSSPEPIRAFRKGSSGSNTPSPSNPDSKSSSPISSRLESLTLDKPNTPPPPPPPLPDHLLLSTGVSQATLGKVQLTIHFLSQYYYGLFQYLKERAERFDLV